LGEKEDKKVAADAVEKGEKGRAEMKGAGVKVKWNGDKMV